MKHMFHSYLRGLLFALIIGVMTGGAVGHFSSLLDYISAHPFPAWVYLFLLSGAMATSAALTGSYRVGTGNRRFSRGIYDASDSRSLSRMLRILLAVVITIGAGGSAGRAGPSAQIGAAVSALLRRIFRTRQQHLVLCGIAAGFAGVLTAPAAGFLLAYGMMNNKPDRPLGFIMGAIASAASTWTAIKVGAPSHRGLWDGTAVLSPSLVLQLLLAAMFFSCAGLIYVWALSATRRLYQALPLNPFAASAAAGVIIALAGILWSTDYLFLGSGRLNSMFQGVVYTPLGALVKLLTTSLTLGFGGAGGVITPMLFVGASVGSSFAVAVSADPGLFAVLGAVSMIAVTANAPLAAVVLSLELFGPGLFIPSVICCTCSYYLSKHRRFRNDELLLLTSPGRRGAVFHDTPGEIKKENEHSPSWHLRR